MIKLYNVVLYFCFLSYYFVNCRFTTTKIGPPPIWNSTHTDKLRQDLLLNYDKFARPAQHDALTTVRFGLSVRHIEIDEFKSTMTVYSWVRLVWADEKLKWDPAEYGDLKVLNLADHEIWQPDLFVYNSAVTTALNHFGSTHCLVYDNGEVLWVPPAQFTVLCQLNLRYWPFDTQECYMKFGSWTYNGDQIDLTIMNNATEVELELLIENSEWTILKHTIKRSVKIYDCCAEPYPDITVTFYLQRVSPSYKAVIVTPAIVVIILTLITFWLPPMAGEKIIINGCTAVIICLFLLYFTQKLPAMGTHTPLIVLFYCHSLYMVSFSLSGSVIVIWLSRTKHTTGLPWVLKKPLTGTVGRVLGLSTYLAQSGLTTVHRVTAEEMRDHQVTDFDDHNSGDEHHIIKSATIKPSLQNDWILLAAAIDRLSFCFYCFVFAILAIVYSI